MGVQRTPHTRARLGHLDPAKIAAIDVDEFVSICCEKPAIHRFPGSMGKRIHQVCTRSSRTTTATPRTSGSTPTRPARCTSGSRRSPATATRSRRSSSPCSARPRVSTRRSARGRRQVRRRRPPLGCRRPRRHLARQGPRVEEGPEGRQEGQAGPTGRADQARSNTTDRAPTGCDRANLQGGPGRRVEVADQTLIDRADDVTAGLVDPRRVRHRRPHADGSVRGERPRRPRRWLRRPPPRETNRRDDR